MKLLLALLLAVPAPAFASSALDELRAAGAAYGLPAPAAPAAPTAVLLKSKKEKKPEVWAEKKPTVLPPNWPAELAMSPVTLAEATAMFEHVRDMNELNWDYMKDGCYARAYLISYELEKKYGVVSTRVVAMPPKGQQFTVLTPRTAPQFLKWNYHTVPMILVTTDIGYVAYVLDPIFADKPLTLEDWQKALESRSPKGVTYNIVSRFVYQDSKNTTAWDDKNLRNSRDAVQDPDRFADFFARRPGR